MPYLSNTTFILISEGGMIYLIRVIGVGEGLWSFQILINYSFSEIEIMWCSNKF